MWCHRLRNCIQRDAAEAWIKEARYGHSYNGRQIGTRMRSMDGAIFNDLEWPLTEILRSYHYWNCIRDRDIVTMDMDLHTSYSRVSLRMTLSDLAKYSMTWGIVQPLRDSWTSCTKHQSYISQNLFRVIDNIIVDVFKIICCSEPTDSFTVNVIVAQLPGHSRAQGFTAVAPAPAGPHLAPLLYIATRTGCIKILGKGVLIDGAS